MNTPRKLATGLFAGALMLAVPGVAGALPQPQAAVASVTTTAVKNLAQKCSDAITARFTQIDTLTSQLDGAPRLTAGHRSSLTSELADERSGLATLQGQINAATTFGQLAQLCPQIVTGYRVYVLETPKTHLTMAADRETSIATQLQGIAPKLEAAITSAQAKGKDVGQAPALYADLTAKVSDAAAQAGPVADRILPLTPAEYNAGTAKPVLETSRDALVQGSTDLTTARNDALQIVQILEGLVGASSSSSTASSTP
jgi:hypothetical protein